MYSRLSLLAGLFACLALASCSSDKRHVFIVTSCNLASSRDLDSAFEVTLGSPGVYTRKHEFVVNGKALTVVQNGSRSHFSINEAGQYLLNMGEDTLLSNPAEYGPQVFDGADISSMIGSLRNRPQQPGGNPRADSIVSRFRRAQERAEKRKEEEAARKGHSGVQTIFPGALARISRNEEARLFILEDAPKQIEVERGTEIEYYEINTFRYWMDRLQRELEKQSEARSGRRF